MKSVKIFLPLLFFAFTISFAQTRVNIQKVDESALSNGESYPVDAGPLLERFNKANGIDLQKLEPIPQQLKKTAWNFSFGSTYSWWASDLRTGANPSFYQVPSTCKKVGTNCYVFVEDSLWNAGRVDQYAVDSVQTAFDLKTPSGSINSSKGIYQNDVDVYGTPPNVDGDSKIIILILDIRDGYKASAGGGYTAGYFYSYNEYTYSQGAPYSNVAEIYYLDGNPLDLKTSGGLKTGMSTTAHEFQHMIHWNYITGDETFFNEGWSLVAEVINGYPLYNPLRYASEPNHYLLDWRRTDNYLVLNDYSRAARFTLYIKEQFGIGILKRYLENGVGGINGLNTALQTLVPTEVRRFNNIFEDWTIANYLNDKNVGTRWGYSYANLPEMATNSQFSPIISNYSGSVYKYGVQYISFTSGKNLKVNFTGAGIKVKAIMKNPNFIPIDVPMNSDFSLPDFGTAYNNLTFAVFVNPDYFVQNANSPVNYSFSSSATFKSNSLEMFYDRSEPIGVLVGAQGDSIAVRFEGVQGAKLDSIKVALRQAGSVDGGVFEFNPNGSSICGKRLAVPITAISSISAKPGVPYPVPWPNWVKVNLPPNIEVSKSFVVAFRIDGDYPATNRVMVTEDYQSDSYNSLSYSTQSNRWLHPFGTDGMYSYLIRAFVSGVPTGVEKVIELMPSSFKLAQNYPNPFNPSTVINYQLPVSGHVSLKVYDILGREVATLVNEFQQAGSHNSQFSIQNSQLSSGIYFYTIKAGNFIETKKMVLMK